MTTYLSQIRETERWLDAMERAGIDRKEAARRILRTKEEGRLRSERRMWSDFQRIYIWASELAPEVPNGQGDRQ